MGVIEMIFGSLFGGGRNLVKDTAEVFRVNAEAEAGRDAAYSQAALKQFAAEFQHARKSPFDRFIDALNRVPRPAMALGVLGLMLSALVDPIWFASRMQGLALVPEPLWWLLGAIVSFYFGARHQAKGQDFQRSIAATMAAAPTVTRNISALRGLDAPEEASAAETSGSNPALDAWRQDRDG